jgi:hypothetical protein
VQSGRALLSSGQDDEKVVQMYDFFCVVDPLEGKQTPALWNLSSCASVVSLTARTCVVHWPTKFVRENEDSMRRLTHTAYSSTLP